MTNIDIFKKNVRWLLRIFYYIFIHTKNIINMRSPIRRFLSISGSDSGGLSVRFFLRNSYFSNSFEEFIFLLWMIELKIQFYFFSIPNFDLWHRKAIKGFANFFYTHEREKFALHRTALKFDWFVLTNNNFSFRAQKLSFVKIVSLKNTLSNFYLYQTFFNEKFKIFALKSCLSVNNPLSVK